MEKKGFVWLHFATILVGFLDDIFWDFGRCFGFISAGFSLVAKGLKMVEKWGREEVVF